MRARTRSRVRGSAGGRHGRARARAVFFCSRTRARAHRASRIARAFTSRLHSFASFEALASEFRSDRSPRRRRRRALDRRTDGRTAVGRSFARETETEVRAGTSARASRSRPRVVGDSCTRACIHSHFFETNERSTGTGRDRSDSRRARAIGRLARERGRVVDGRTDGRRRSRATRGG